MGKTYRISSAAHQKLQVGDEPDATLVGGSGAWDTLIAGNGDRNQINMGTGSHQLGIVGDGKENTIAGGSGAHDTLVGGDGGCTFYIGPGSDQLARGGIGDDSFHFGSTIGADDTVIGGGGHNTVHFNNHDSKHNVLTRDAHGAIVRIIFTDISRTINLENIRELHFSDGIVIV